MKINRMLILASALFTVLVISCKQSEKDERSFATEETAISESLSQSSETKTTSAAKAGKQETRKFIRTADLKFKVKNVAKTTYAIETITAKAGGFIAYTNLQSVSNRETTNRISADSSVVTKYFTVENEMILRVPNTQLDSTLKAIAPLVDYLDFRIIKADDVSLKMLANSMIQNRSKENERRLANAIDTKGKKLNDITTAEDGLAAKKEAADNSEIENLSLRDQVNFSTVNIAMYQREEIRREFIANEKSSKYEQGLGSQLLDSLRTGWYMISAIVVFLTQLWVLFAIGIAAYIFYKKRQQSKTK